MLVSGQDTTVAVVNTATVASCTRPFTHGEGSGGGGGGGAAHMNGEWRAVGIKKDQQE